MADDQLQVEVTQLRTFATSMRTLAGDLRAETQLHQQPATAVNFGQTIDGFGTADELFSTFHVRAGDFLDNLTSLVHAIDGLATAAETIAGRYRDAATEDAVQATTVDDVFRSLPPMS